MEPQVITTVESQLSPFMMYKTRLDLFQSTSAEDDKIPHLTFLRVELNRLRSGMSDFLFRVSAPGPTPGAKPTVVTLRGDKSFATLNGLESAAKVIFREMKKRGDSSFNWSNADTAYLAKMLLNQCKFFTANPSAETLSFTTDALK